MSAPNVHEFQMTGADGLQIACARWSDDRPVRGIVQIAHGMGEHMGRYLELIELMVEAGMIVYGNDHRGHGRTAASSSDLGNVGEGGFNLLVEDMVQLSQVARNEHPREPLILLGHCMGSFAAQRYIRDHSELIEGLVLSGSGTLDGLQLLARSAFSGENLLNARFARPRTPFDWLSRDEAIVDAFMNDPLCFKDLKSAAEEYLLSAASELADADRLRGIRYDLPIYLFSGSEDPVGQQLEGVRVLLDRYREAGVFDLSHHFYHGGRHEMLNETNREEVRTNLMLWISEVLCW